MKQHPFYIIKKARFWVCLAIGLSVCSLFVFLLNLNFSEEFTGGVSLSLSSTASMEGLDTSLHNYLDSNSYPTSRIFIDTEGDTTTIKVNANLGSDELVAQLSEDVKNFLISEQVIESANDIVWQTIIGPSVGDYMKTTAVQAFVLGLLLMVIYILFSFGKIRKDIPAQILGIAVLGVLLFEVCTSLGAYGARMIINPTIQVDTVFIIAILTICGYGVNDIIIIFDRIRENLLKHRSSNQVDVKNVIEDSLWQTMQRSIGTCLSTVLVLVAMLVFGTGALQQFAFTVLVGVVMTAFASIFLGGSLVSLMMQMQNKQKKTLKKKS